MLKISKINWGDDSAEKDQNLFNYFVFQGEFERVIQLQKNFVIGRKGVGKSALLKKINKDFISTTNVDRSKHIVCTIRPSSEIGTKIDVASNFNNIILFQYAWLVFIYRRILQHIGDLAVDSFKSPVIREARQFALENRIAIPSYIEELSNLISSAKIKIGSGGAELALEKAFKKEHNFDSIESHLKKIGNENNKLLILIDDLDYSWDNSVFSNNFLLGLLLALDYAKASISNFHSIVFIRDDIYNILMKKTPQSDKYRNYYHIKWTQDEIAKILKERIKYGYYEQNLAYPSSDEKALTDVFPTHIGTKKLLNWLYERTFGRPRDILQIARLYTEKNVDNKPNSEIFLQKVDPEYSDWKLNDLCTEYLHQYENLKDFFEVLKFHLKGRPYSMDKEVIFEVFGRVFEEDLDIPWLREIKEKKDPRTALLNLLFDLYFIGDRVSPREIIYKSEHSYKPKFDCIDIHPAFRSVFSLVKKTK